ncbi:hypothetical protein B0H19DRAFT_1175952 [Mycena capillaripes]|nr:hypothetical protein B0H19DRAFT_1175952 [Mycena capillaripes]
MRRVLYSTQRVLWLFILWHHMTVIDLPTATLYLKAIHPPSIHPRSFDHFSSALFSLKNSLIFAKSHFDPV